MIVVRKNLGSAWDDAAGALSVIESGLSTLGPYLPTIQNVLDDPALPAVLYRVKVLRSLEIGGNGTSGGDPSIRGIGLSRALGPLDAYIWYRKNPWVVYAGGALIALLALHGLKHRKA